MVRTVGFFFSHCVPVMEPENGAAHVGSVVFIAEIMYCEHSDTSGFEAGF